MPSRTAPPTMVLASTSPYQLDSAQVQRASKALVRKLQEGEVAPTNGAAKTDLLADADAEDASDVQPVWLVLTTKKHIVDKKRLKPGKIVVPHPYIKSQTGQTLRVCLITADPQRKYKDLVADPAFPLDTSKHIARVIGLEKLKAKYNSYESKRQLMGEYDVFLADDRIITYLPAVLGKVFYKSSTKRPIPVTLEGRRQAMDEQGNKRRKLAEGGSKVVKHDAKPADIAAEIEKAFSSALIHLAPSTTTAVKVGSASMPPEHISKNIEVVVAGLVETYVPQKWRNIRAIHIKGPKTIALPIWMTDELWTDAKDDILEKAPPAYGVRGTKRKSKALDGEPAVIEVPGADGKMRTVKKPEVKGRKAIAQTEEVEDKDAEAAARAARKDRLRSQKAALGGVGGNIKAAAVEKIVKPIKKRMKAADLI